MKIFSNLNSLGKGIAGFVLLVVGLVFLIIVFKNTLNDFPIWFFGRDVSAVVEETWVEKTGENNAGELTFQYFIRYNFTAPSGESVTGTSSLAGMEWSGISEGSEVKVTYFPPNPSHNRLNDSRFMLVLLCSYIPLIVLTWFGLFAGWKLISADFKREELHPWTFEN